MKAISKWIFLSIAIILLSGCLSLFYDEPTTFADVSETYEKQYGKPDDITTFSTENFRSITWSWTFSGRTRMVTFCDSRYDDYYGWKVESTSSY